MRALLSLTALSLVFLIGAWYWSESATHDIAEGHGVAEEAVADDRPAGEPVIPQAGGPEVDERAGAFVGERTPARVLATEGGLARPIEPPPEGGRVLTVVDRASGTPVAFADVLQLEPALLGARGVQALVEDVLANGLGALGDLEVVGRRWQADGEGHVRVARRPVATLIVAFAPGAVPLGGAGSGDAAAEGADVAGAPGAGVRGFAVLAGVNAGGVGDTGDALVRGELEGAGDTGATVALAAPRELLVDVVRGAGAPVPGALVTPGGDFWEGGPPIWRADVDGRVRVRVHEASTLLAALATLDDSGSGPSGFMVGILRSARRDMRRVDLMATGSGPLTATVTATGAPLTVQLVDPFGVPMGIPGARVIVRLGDQYPRYALDAEGRLELPALPLALQTRVSLHPDSPIGSYGSPVPVQGDIGAQGLDLVLTLGAPPVERIRFRAVDGDGEPLTHTKLTVDASQVGERGGGRAGSRELLTDADGRVEHADGSVAAFARTPGTLRLQLTHAGTEPQLVSEPIVLTSMGSPVAAGTWPLDLGDVALVPGTPVLAGRVVLGTGEPLPNARIEVRELELGESGSGRRVARVRSGADGRFAVYAALAEPGTSTLSIEAEHPGYGSTGNQPAKPWEANLELVVGHTGVLVASVRALDRPLTAGLALRLQPMDADALSAFSPASPNGLTTSGEWAWSGFDDQGVVELRNLVPGAYRVQLAAGNEVLAEFADVFVSSGAVTRDPRLTGMHLRDHLHVVEVRVVDATGAPVENVYYLTPDAAFEERLRSPLVTATLPLELTLMAKGHLTTVVEVTQPFLDVVMPASFHVNLRLPEGVAPNLDVEVALVPWTQEFDPFNAAYRYAPFANGTARVELMGAGRQRVLIKARDRSGAAGKSAFFEARSVELEVQPSDADRTFDLALSAAEQQKLEL